MRTKRFGFTIVELLVVVAIISLLIAILLPAIQKARETALVTQSISHLKNLGTANMAYGSDYGDRQFTLCGDDWGLYSGNCDAIKAVYCPAQCIIGWDSGGGLWGYWLGGGGRCPDLPTGCGNLCVLYPNNGAGCGWSFGSFRLPNMKAFNDYINGRYYDKVYYAPKDTWSLERAAFALQYPGEFCPPNLTGGDVIFSTYVWSPAAMWNPCVFDPPTQGPCPVPTSAACFKSPAISQAKYPDQKTWMIEWYWLQNREGGEFAPCYNPAEPYLYKHGYNSTPATLWFDGHVSVFGMGTAMESHQRILSQNQPNGLWFGCGAPTNIFVNGAYGDCQCAYDMLIDTNCHVATVEGIQGRDTVVTQ